MQSTPQRLTTLPSTSCFLPIPLTNSFKTTTEMLFCALQTPMHQITSMEYERSRFLKLTVIGVRDEATLRSFQIQGQSILARVVCSSS
jgi:hypothetical protein